MLGLLRDVKLVKIYDLKLLSTSRNGWLETQRRWFLWCQRRCRASTRTMHTTPVPARLWRKLSVKTVQQLKTKTNKHVVLRVLLYRFLKEF